MVIILLGKWLGNCWSLPTGYMCPVKLQHNMVHVSQHLPNRSYRIEDVHLLLNLEIVELKKKKLK